MPPFQGGKTGGGKRLHSLSLEKFAAAKKSTYDPRVVKDKERARAAITVAKYRKLKKRLQGADATAPLLQHDNDAPDPSEHEDEEEAAIMPTNNTGNRNWQEKGHRKPAEEVTAREDQNEQEAEAAAQQRQEAQQRRRSQHKSFQKKTHRGQPVMKYRIEKVLEQLEKQ